MKKLLIFISLFFLALQFSNGQSADEAETQKKTQKVKVFPNPATNVVNILGLQNSNSAAIQITDAYGNLVLRHNWVIKNNAINIPITTLDSGVYTVFINSKEQQLSTRFYKQ